MAAYDARAAKEGRGEADEKKRHLALMNASEVKVVRYVKDLLDPPDLERFRPRAVEERVADHVGESKADEDLKEGGLVDVQPGVVGEEGKEERCS